MLTSFKTFFFIIIISFREKNPGPLCHEPTSLAGCVSNFRTTTGVKIIRKHRAAWLTYKFIEWLKFYPRRKVTIGEIIF